MFLEHRPREVGDNRGWSFSQVACQVMANFVEILENTVYFVQYFVLQQGTMYILFHPAAAQQAAGLSPNCLTAWRMQQE